MSQQTETSTSYNNDDSEQLIAKINQAYENSTPIVIEGNGTKRFLGHHINDEHEVIHTRQHSGIIQYEPVELVMTARAGTTLSDIDYTLAQHGQMLACDPARFGGKATIGGSLASNQAGPCRPWSGSLRDHVLGVNLINGKGDLLNFGGQVMKNVAGYDVSRLQAGAMGTFGLMTEISFNVLPFAKASHTLHLPCAQLDALNIMNSRAGKPSPLNAASWSAGALFLQFSGAKSAVEQAVEQQLSQHPETHVFGTKESQNFWEQLRDQTLDFFQDDNTSLWRLSVKPTAWDSFSESIDEDQWLVDWGGALRWLKEEFDEEALSAWAGQHGGEIVRYRSATHSASHTKPNQIRLPATHAVSRRIQTHIKNSFDPQRILNAGRLYHWM